MSERINTAKEVRNVDRAFDPEARQAQNDWDTYLDSRPYEDDSGKLHNANNGQFISNPNIQTDDEYYSRMQSESETEGPFAGKGLKDIAEMVREAKQTGDKTLELDARAAFDDKFVEIAEKYDWQGTVENADGTTTDRNAIADQKLAHFEAIMAANDREPKEANSIIDADTSRVDRYGEKNKESENGDQPEVEHFENDASSTSEKLDLHHVKDKRRNMVKQGLSPREVGNLSDDEIARYHLVKREPAGEERDEAIQPLQSENISEDSSNVKPLENSTTGKDALDPVKPLENSNDASGKPLQNVKTEESPADVEPLQNKNVRKPRTIRENLKGIIRNPGAYLGAKRVHNVKEKDNENKDSKRKLGGFAGISSKINERLSYYKDKLDNMNERDKRKARVALGVGAVAMAAITVYANRDGFNFPSFGDSMPSPNDTGGNLPSDPSHVTEVLSDSSITSPEVTTGGSPDTGGDWFSDGSGGEALMSSNGIDSSVWYEHQNEFAEKFPELTYHMGDGNVGLIDQSSASSVSKLPEEAQKFWQQYK